MANDSRSAQVDYVTLQQAYKVAVEQWIAAIRAEEALASVHPSVAQVDTWEHAHFAEEDARNNALKAKKEYEDGLRQGLFGF
jgi:hypothetical protein